MTSFSELLKQWRTQRRLSQLDLSLEADVSARHISFLETGRARPTSDMIVRLSEALGIPLEVRNQMLAAVGFAPRYSARHWDDAEMAPIRQAVDWTLQRHAPYPALALDRHWTLLRLNGPASMLFGTLGLAEGANMLDLMLRPDLPQFVENWPEVAHHTALRLRSESLAAGGIPQFDAAAKQLAKDAAPGIESAPTIPTIFCMGDMRLSLFGTVAQFASSADQTLEDMKIELFFPANAQAETILNSMAEPNF